MSYLLITPARNEERFIELTIQSVIAQTRRPTRWVIVSDGSTDRTDEIVEVYARQHQWIELVRMPERKTRDFGGKARSVNTAYDRVKHIPHDLVASLDADITLPPDYFEFLIGKFAEQPRLGVGGTPFAEEGHTYDYRFSSRDHVSGACQVFRRECFEQIGGYTAARDGGLDVIAVLSARMNGWVTWTFTEKHCSHHRVMGLGVSDNVVMASFRLGERGYRLGFHPVWQVFRSFYQMSRKPYVTAGAALLAGYCWAMVRRVDRILAPELVAFQRRDQMRRLRALFGFAQRAA